MKEQFVTYEIALKLRELGFNNSLLLFGNTPYFINRALSICNSSYSLIFPEKEYVLAPLWQQVIDWLRDKYNIHIEIESFSDGTYVGLVVNNNLENEEAKEGYFVPSFYEARERAILEALEVITNN